MKGYFNSGFGLVTAPATFSRLMRKVLFEMENNFIDDIIIFAQTFEKHLERLEELFQRLRTAGLTAKPIKCSLAYSSLNCLGHVLGNKQLRSMSDKLRTKQDAQRPKTKNQLRSFLGLTESNRKFVPNFACVALPLTFLTKKGAQQS